MDIDDMRALALTEAVHIAGEQPRIDTVLLHAAKLLAFLLGASPEPSEDTPHKA